MSNVNLHVGSLPAGTNQSPPSGYAAPTNLLPTLALPTVGANGLATPTNGSLAGWVKTTDFTGDIIHLTLKLNTAKANVPTSPMAGIVGGVLFIANSDNSKAVLVSAFYTAGAGFRLKIGYITNQALTISKNLIFDYPNALDPLGTTVELYYNKLTGLISAFARIPGDSVNGKKRSITTIVPTHTGLSRVGFGSAKLTLNVEDFTATDENVVYPKVVDIPAPTYGSTTNQMVCYGFVPQHANILGLPVDITATSTSNGVCTATFTLGGYNTWVGNNLYPTNLNQTMLPVSEPYLEVSYSGGVSYAVADTLVTANFAVFPQATLTPSDGGVTKALLSNYYTDSLSNVVIISQTNRVDVNGTFVTVGFTNGLVSTDATAAMPTPLAFFVQTAGGKFRKFQINLDGNFQITSLSELIDTQNFQPTFGAAFNTEYTSNDLLVGTATSNFVVSGGASYAIKPSGGSYGAWILGTTPSNLLSTDTIKIKGTSSKFKDRVKIFLCTIGVRTVNWTLRTRLDKQYEVDFSLTPEQQILALVNYENETDMTFNDVDVYFVSTGGPGGTSVIARIDPKGTYKHQGNVDVIYKRLNVVNFATLSAADFTIDSPTPTNVVAAFNAKYGTTLTVADFNFTAGLPVPDYDGEPYHLIPKTGSLAYEGDLPIVIRKTTYPLSSVLQTTTLDGLSLV